MSTTRFISTLLFLLAFSVLVLAKPVERANEIAARCSGGCTGADVLEIFVVLKASVTSACGSATGTHAGITTCITAIIAACNIAITALVGITITITELGSYCSQIVEIVVEILVLIVVTLCRFNILIVVSICISLDLSGCLCSLLTALNGCSSGIILLIGTSISLTDYVLFLALGLTSVLSLCGL